MAIRGQKCKVFIPNYYLILIFCKGIIPRLVNQLFEHIKTAPETSKLTVKFSVIEIQNEKIKDLLKPERVNLKLREDRLRGVCIESLYEASTSREEDILSQLKIAERNKSNASPSKSHFIIMLTIRQNNTNDSNIKVSKLYLADLAGTEKIMRASDGSRLRSTNTSICKSLSALGNVINVLAESKNRHVPYRYSTLTRILKDSLGGNSKTSLIITCSPSSIFEQETLNTLKFGSRAKLIKNIPKIKTELTMPQLQKLYNRAEKDIYEKNKRIEALENLLRENGVDIPIESRTENSSIMDSRSDINRNILL